MWLSHLDFPSTNGGFSGFPRSHGRLTGEFFPPHFDLLGKTPKNHMFIALFSHHNYNNLISGWWFQPTPLKNDGVSNSWDDDIPNMMGKS
jgi:hypothetical protein